jgi:flagellar hook assembly protein FlgD
MRDTRVFRALVLGSVVAVAVVAGQARPAFALDPPTTTPAFTAPVAGSTVGGFVTVTATSSAPTVQFFAYGGPLGGPIPVVDGSASTSLETWGAPNSPVEINAADCNDAGCGPLVSVTVQVSNPAPAITSPSDGATTGPLPTISATANGGSVFFRIDPGTSVDLTPPFEFTPSEPLPAGQHVVIAQSCNTAGTWCSGSVADITITVAVPAITSIVPPVFSPNGDGRVDTTKVTFSLPDSESVSWSVVDGLDAVVQGPNDLGVLGAGSHSFVWSGLDNAQTRVPDGTYEVVLATTTADGTKSTGSATAPVRVDTTAPTLGAPTGANTAFYPVHDGFRDTFASRVSVNEPGNLWLAITTTTGHTVRLLKLTHAAAGTFTLVWNGLDAAGHLVPAGTYHFHWIADDTAANRRNGPNYNVVVSLRHLVTKAAIITKHGSAFDYVDASKSCAGGNAAQSAFRPNGLRLYNSCSRVSNEAGLAQYSFAVPAAISYSTLRIQAYGFSADAPVGVASLIWNFAVNDADVVAGAVIPNRTPAWNGLGGVTAAQHVSSHHVVTIAIALLNVTSPALYDIGFVRLTVTYRVLS